VQTEVVLTELLELVVVAVVVEFDFPLI